MRCAVVGSGVSGMTAALMLARQGHSVTLLEAGPHPAPLLQGFTRRGLHFDTGFHYGGGLHQGGVLRQWLQALGLWQHLQPVSQPHSDIFCFAGQPAVTLPAGTERILAAVAAQFPGQQHKLAPWLDNARAVLDHSPYTNAALKDNSVSWRGQSRILQDTLAAQDFPPLLHALLGARCLLYGVSPEQALWEDYALVAGPYFESCGSWQGGGAALVWAFMREMAECGVNIRVRATVTGIDAVPPQSGQAERAGLRGLWLASGEYIPCEHCYFTGHPGQLQRVLPPGLVRPAWFSRIKTMPETPQAMLLFAETTALPPGHSRYLLPPLGDELLSPLGSPCPSLYLACGHNENTAPEDKRVPLMVLALLPPQHPVNTFHIADNIGTRGTRGTRGTPVLPGTADYATHKARLTAELTALTEARCPELRGNWQVLESATPHSLRRWVHGSSGSLYGFAHDNENLPLLPVTRVPGLFLAGQNILLPGVLGGIVSAALAVGFAHGHATALKEFRTCENA